MDGFTAGCLLGAVMNGADNDKVADLYKELKGSDSGLDQKKVAAAEALKGKRVGFNCSVYVGTVEGANMKTGGFYGGDRYPILVKIDQTNDGKTGRVFEYDFPDLFLLDEPGVSLSL